MAGGCYRFVIGYGRSGLRPYFQNQTRAHLSPNHTRVPRTTSRFEYEPPLNPPMHVTSVMVSAP